MSQASWGVNTHSDVAGVIQFKFQFFINLHVFRIPPETLNTKINEVVMYEESVIVGELYVTLIWQVFIGSFVSWLARY